MFIHQKIIYLFILILITIIINTKCSSFKGRDVVLKRKAYQKRNENFDDKALERTLKKLRTDYGRLLLLVCKAKCLKERADIAEILNEYNKNNINIQNFHEENNESKIEFATNISKIETEKPLGFHVHYYQNSFPIREVEKAVKKSSKQMMVFYVSGGKIYQMPDKYFTKKEDFLKWLKSYEQPTNIKLIKSIELDEWLNSGCNGEVSRRSLKQTVLLVVHDIRICPEPLLKNFARSFMDRPNFAAIELRRPISEENEFILQWRLKGIDELCRIIILLRGNGFIEIKENLISEFYQLVGNISQIKINKNCTDPPQTMQEIMPELSPIELEFFREESHLKSIEQNRQYLAVGTIGGIAVVALAMSIFWGLNGNDFVPKK